MESWFLLNFFKENFIYTKNVISMHIHSGTPLARPPAARQSIGRVFGSGVVVLVDLITLVFLTFFDVIASKR